MFDMLKDTQNLPCPWFNVVPSLEKQCQVVVARNEQANLQPTLNKGKGRASLTIFVADCSLLVYRSNSGVDVSPLGPQTPYFGIAM